MRLPDDALGLTAADPVKPMTIRAPKTIHLRLLIAARRVGRPAAALAVEALRLYLDELEARLASGSAKRPGG